MHVSPAWFASNRPTRSQSLECLVNSSRTPCKRRRDVALLDDEEETACFSSPTNFRPMNSKVARRSRTLIDDHNLPTSISSGFFGTLMKFEKNRLRTFKNWPLDYMTPGELAKAGFYYLLTSDLVRCFECKITLFKWELGDRAILEHYKNNPKCPLINGYDVGNVPIDRKPLDVLQDFIDLDEFQPVMPNEDPICSFGYLSSDQELEELDEDAQIFDRERIVHQDSQTEQNAPQSFSEDQLFELMRSEEMRLKTFDTWPRHLVDLVKPADLARCGYFFTTIKDKVICAFCKVPTWNWEATDVPIKEHYKHNQDCPLLNDQECGNQPIKPVLFKELLLEFSDIAPSCSSYSDEDEVSFFLSRPESFERQLSSDSCSSQPRAPISNETLNELNKYKDLSKLFLAHKSVDKYYTFEDRLKTFEKWPLQQMNKNRLADAGFYFLGECGCPRLKDTFLSIDPSIHSFTYPSPHSHSHFISFSISRAPEYNDQVKCFSCDLVLSHWSNSDDPWIEHCKYSSNCEYLILQKGNEFITRNAKSK